MNLIWTWLSKHWSSVGMGLLLCWVSIGVTYTTFVKPSIKAGVYNAASEGLKPQLGVNAGQFWVGCATFKK